MDRDSFIQIAKDGLLIKKHKSTKFNFYDCMYDMFGDDDCIELYRRSYLPETDAEKVYPYTLVVDDGNAGYIYPGLKRVNRIGYFFAKKPLDIPDEGILFWDADKDGED